MSLKQPFCLMPWLHFHVSDKGNVNACCVSTIPYGNVNTDSFEEIWKGDKINEIRANFSAGKIDPRCQVCVNVELGGGKSIREETFEKFPDFSIDSVQSPIYFDIRFSNVCNLKCRTCWHGASSSWFQDAKTLKREVGTTAIIKNMDDFDSFLKEYGHALLSAKEIYFAGGEPLITEEHYLLLDFLRLNKVHNVSLRYNTNFTKLTFKGMSILDYWKDFNSVEILASIDGIEEHGEYVRQNLKWKSILENREKVRGLSNVKFKIAPTISLLNVFEFLEFYPQLVKDNFIGINDIYINLLDRPWHYNIKALPKKKKELLQSKFKKLLMFAEEHNASEETIQHLHSILKFSLSEDKSGYWEKFNSETQKLDSLFKA